jgi:hypothetical protein
VHLNDSANKHCWCDEFVDAVELFAEATTAAHGFGDEIAGTQRAPLEVGDLASRNMDRCGWPTDSE